MPKEITIPCLSVQQPFADLICAGVKTVENRTWKTDYRGSILIHASDTVKPTKAWNTAMNNKAFKIVHDDKYKHPSDENDFNYDEIINDPEALRQLAIMAKWKDANENPSIPPMRTGAIIGIVDLVDIKSAKDGVDNPWYIEGNYAWILEKAEFFAKPLIYRKGKLRLYQESIDPNLMTIDLLEWYRWYLNNDSSKSKQKG